MSTPNDVSVRPDKARGEETRGAGSRTWKLLGAGALCGLMYLFAEYDGPGFYYHCLALKIPCPYEVANHTQWIFGPFWLVLAAWAASLPWRQWLTFVAAGLLTHVASKSYSFAVGKDFEHYPVSLQEWTGVWDAAFIFSSLAFFLTFMLIIRGAWWTMRRITRTKKA